MKVLMREQDLSDRYVRFAQQIGADGFDIHNPDNVPGFKEQGYPDQERLVQLRTKLRAAGLGIYRLAPPTPRRFLLGQPGGDEELEQLGRTVAILGRAGIPIMSMPLHLEDNPGYLGGVSREHRGGYTMHGFEMEIMRRRLAAGERGLLATAEEYWERAVRMYQHLVPIAENAGVKLVLHPSDPPLPEAPFSPRRWVNILDAVPSESSGLLYCIGTRCESGVNILQDIHNLGRKGRIFHTHFRNVRGTIPASGGYEEVALDDGDMNMFQVLRALRDIGFEGGLQIDHVPTYLGDTPHAEIGSAYAVGYVRALLAALAAR
jgi:mannonate dehydratase